MQAALATRLALLGVTLALTAAVLCALLPAGAAAQAGGGRLSQTPPVALGNPPAPRFHHAGGSGGTTGKLPNTGYDVVAVVLLGTCLLLLGFGLRLRTREVRWPDSPR